MTHTLVLRIGSELLLSGGKQALVRPILVVIAHVVNDLLKLHDHRCGKATVGATILLQNSTVKSPLDSEQPGAILNLVEGHGIVSL
jgi:hypothetical protein